jgi:hypothetical protein
MKYNSCKLLIAALCGLAYLPAFGAQTIALTPDWIVQDRATGLHYSDFSAPSGWATSSGNANAPGCVANIGTMYSGTTTFFGPSRYAQFTFTPTVTGIYQIDLAWPSSGGEHNTAVNLYTGAATGSATLDQWGNSGGPLGVLFSGTMDMYYLNPGVWNTFTTTELDANTTYHVGIYGGYKAPDANENRVCIGAVGFTMVAQVPEPSTALLGLLGGLGILTCIRRRTA